MKKNRRLRNLPPCLYLKHGSYWLVKKNKWTKLSSDYKEALCIYADLMTSPAGGMEKLCEEAFPHISHGLSKNTKNQYRMAIDRIKTIFKEFSPSQVKQVHVAQLKNSMNDKPFMCNRLMSVLRLVFNYALEHGQIENNPCIGVHRHYEKKRSVYFNDEDFQSVISATPHLYLANIMKVQFLTGQRISDVLSIKISHITEDGIEFTQQKTNKKLLVKTNLDLRKVICETMKIRRQGEYLFQGKNGKLSYGTVRDAFNRAKLIAGVKDVTLHDIRARSLTHAKRQGQDATILAGHSQPSMTDRYIRIRATDIATGPTFD